MLIHQGTDTMMNTNESTAEKASTLSSPRTSSFHISSAPSDLSQLDEIWGKDISKVSLPDYVKKNSTTITFPEKVREKPCHFNLRRSRHS